VPAAQDVLEGAEERLDLPAGLVDEAHQVGFQVHAVGDQTQAVALFRSASCGLAEGFSMRRAGDLDYLDGSAQIVAGGLAAEAADAVAQHAGPEGLGRQGPFFHHLQDGVVVQASHEGTGGIDDGLKEGVLGVAAVDDVEPVRPKAGVKTQSCDSGAASDSAVTADRRPS